MKVIYLDVCTYYRPFDNQDALRIRLFWPMFLFPVMINY